MNMALEESSNPNLEIAMEEESMRAARLANAVAFPMVLRAAMEMGVLNTISAAGEDAWLSPSEIARDLPTKPTNPQAPMLLDRVLRLLVSYSIVKCRMVRTGESREMVYAVEPICKFFHDDKQDSATLLPSFKLFHSDLFIKTWIHLDDMILHGRDAFTRAHGVKVFEYLEKDKEVSSLYNRAMWGHSLMLVKKVLEVYKGFEGVNSMVDVGGGVGTSIGLITIKYPNIKGINFDLANVLVGAVFYPGVEHVVGDMFVEVPKADSIFMKWILHDWNDEDCIKILKNCWKALPNKGKMIIVDKVVPDNPNSGDVYSNIAYDLDMTMLSIYSGAKERTRYEFEALAKNSGFIHCKFICSVFHCWIMEFHKDS